MALKNRPPIDATETLCDAYRHLPPINLTARQFGLVGEPRFMSGAGIADFAHDGCDIGNSRIRRDAAVELDLIVQRSTLVVRPYFVAELHRGERERKTTELVVI
jgi:hypothetical protein